MEVLLLPLSAIWLGILTSISPCPLTANIAAISYTTQHAGRRQRVLLAGLLYALGRSLTYAVIGVAVVSLAVNTPLLSNFLQQYANKALGFILVLAGMFLLRLLPETLIPDFSIGGGLVARAGASGGVGSLLLGVVLALAFCPVSAALFFGSLIPLAISAGSSILLPALYGVGTAVPVLAFAILLAAGISGLGALFARVTAMERYTRPATGVVFILAGLYYILAYVFGVL